MLSLLVVLFGITLSTNPNIRRATASNQALADQLAQQVRAVRQQAISSRTPTALCLPTSGGTKGHAQAYYVARGVNQPTVLRTARLDTEYPDLSLFAGYWDGVEAELGNQAFQFNGQDIPLTQWAGPLADETIFLFAPNGTVVSNSPLVDNAYHIIVCTDPVYGQNSVDGRSVPRLSQAKYPYTVRIDPSGSASLQTGIPQGQSVSSAGQSIEDRGSVALPPPRDQQNADPVLEPIEIAPQPLAANLPPGVDATVDEKGYLTLTALATDLDGDQLYVGWEVEPEGAFSSPSRLPMEWIDGQWKSTWEWRPLAAPGTLYTLTCRIWDDRGGEDSRPLGATGQVLVTGDGKVVFSDGPNNDIDLFAMNADGTNLTQLTDNPGGEDYYPQVSPDGRKVLFISWGRPQGNGLYVCDIDGKNVTKITPNLPAPFVNVFYACWSPDGSEIAFIPWDGTVQSDTKLFVCNADGSNSTEIADIWPSRVNRTVSWVWDRTLPYDPQQTQFLMNGEIGDGGEEETALVDRATGSLSHLNDFINPALSPDGTRVAYGDPNSYDLFVADFPGYGNPRMISSQGAGPVTWHPAGAKLMVYKPIGQEYCVLNADGSGEKTLRNNATYAHLSSWAP